MAGRRTLDGGCAALGDNDLEQGDTRMPRYSIVRALPALGTTDRAARRAAALGGLSRGGPLGGRPRDGRLGKAGGQWWLRLT